MGLSEGELSKVVLCRVRACPVGYKIPYKTDGNIGCRYRNRAGISGLSDTGLNALQKSHNDLSVGYKRLEKKLTGYQVILVGYTRTPGTGIHSVQNSHNCRVR